MYLLVVGLQTIPLGHADQILDLTNYQLGQGLKIDNTGWNVGGYGTVALEVPEHEDPQLDISHLALMLWWEGDSKFKFMSEIDWEDTLAIQRSPENNNEYLSLERFYLDYNYDDLVNFRLGKFLTPIGRWNTIHADPLVWTTSRPQITQAVFPTNATGLMVFGNGNFLNREFDYSVYASSGDELRPSPKIDPFENAFGTHISTPTSQDSQLGVSFANFEQTDSNSGRKILYGADYIWTHNRYELSGEIVYRYAERGQDLDEKGAYVQLVVPLSTRLYGVFRFEPFFSGTSADDRVWVAGVAMRFNPALVVKAELIHGGDPPTIQDGFLSSISALF